MSGTVHVTIQGFIQSALLASVTFAASVPC